MKYIHLTLFAVIQLWSFALAGAACAQTIRIGVVNTFSGPQASYGGFSNRGAQLYLKLHAKELPAGLKVEFLDRDDGGPNPDKARQLAQELVVRDKVDLLMGTTFTPNAIAIAQVADEAKIPYLITNAAASMITTKSPYVARFSFTLAQTATPLGAWAAKNAKTAYTLVSDYAPGHDAEAFFLKSFTAGGGTSAGSVRVPVTNQDFSAYMQRVKDARPDVLMVFVPGGKSASALMKSFEELGLKQAGIKLIGTGDIVPDEELPNMGDEALGTVTTSHYSAASERPANKAFVAAWRQEYGADSTPNFVAAAGYDAMAAIVQAIKAQGGRLEAQKTMEALKNFTSADSPRGPISIDPATRDIVQNVYLRELRKVNGKLANVELSTAAEALKDPGKPGQ